MKQEIVKCTGCKCDLPMEQLNELNEPTYFAAYKGTKMIEFICSDCWEKAIRYQYNKG